MELVFDDKGNLQPYTPIVADLETLESVFAVSEHRKALFEVYLQYVAELKALLEVPFVQWVNGSYVTKKEKPKDIDIVSFVECQVYKAKEKQLRELNTAIYEKKIDAYFVAVYPTNHKYFNSYEMDLAQWKFDFSTKINLRTNKRESKGFLEIHW
ncbi:MAG: hypothetical protein MUE81_08890 [Thermoflexibacter sp.]|jgi:hypothetical protein|nr:hypothetical protein [Thermoflexibacter sp.]